MTKYFLLPINNWFFLLITSFLLTGCSHWVKIANLSIVSTRINEIKSDYKELQRFAEGYDDGKSISASGGTVYVQNNGRLTAAIEDAIRNVPGGEIMKNVTVSTKNGKIKVVGDVWGLIENANKNQFGHNIDIGDKVIAKLSGKYVKGEVISVDANKAMVKYLDDYGTEKYKKFDYDDLTKDSKASTQTAPIQAELLIGDFVTWKKSFGDEYDRGNIIGFKGNYAVIQYTNKEGKEKTREILKSNLTKMQPSKTTK